MPRIELILGTVQFGIDYGINNRIGRPNKETVFRMLDEAYSAGIRQLDSAGIYGDAEALVEAYIERSGNQFLLNTKLGSDENKAITFANSLASKDAIRFNICFLHQTRELSLNVQVLNILEELKYTGKINSIGASVYTNEELENCLLSPIIDVIQLPFNLLDNNLLRRVVLEKAKTAGKILQGRSIFLQGLFFRSVEQLPKSLQGLAGPLTMLNGIARKHQITMHELAIGYAKSQSNFDAIIVGVDSIQQLRSDIAAFDSCILPEKIREEIDALSIVETPLLYPYNW